MEKSKEEIWLGLAELFFESPKPKSDNEVQEFALILTSAGWTRKRTEWTLLCVIAPHGKRYIGYGLPLAIGEEIDFFEKDNLIPKLRRTELLREQHPSRYYWLLQDCLNRFVLKKVKADRLLDLLQ